jgi:hypothetical protein
MKSSRAAPASSIPRNAEAIALNVRGTSIAPAYPPSRTGSLMT